MALRAVRPVFIVRRVSHGMRVSTLKGIIGSDYLGPYGT